eukprot:CAMPEP_0119280822 /NCGR_PEP_ID=MMETSP1329-20130426/23483_1 /TAXON_ID=114041 /ORGANISM="Genus nov. species nov., Strain RCC1024" /LENGTH=301 /DNA_ID=CAMNT_0007281421 /DNA_START=61 /DNA_END=963 /DNA_ORIENTATION=+
MSQQRPRVDGGARGGRLGLPEDVLDHVLAFGDLRSLGASAAASKAFRDSHARTGLARRLVVRRFPILRAAGTDDVRAPRELFLSQQRLFGEYEVPRPRLAPTTALTDYTFSVEIELLERTTPKPVPLPPGYKFDVTGKRDSIYVGKATVMADGKLEFTIPAGIYAIVNNTDREYKDNIRFMVSRRTSQGLEYAFLAEGNIDEGDINKETGKSAFYLYSLGHLRGKLGFRERAIAQTYGHRDELPFVGTEALWKSGNLSSPSMFESVYGDIEEHSASKMRFKFTWDTEEDSHDMSAEDICLA